MFLCPANVTFLLAMRWDMFREDRFLGKVLDEWIADSQEFVHTKLPKLIVIAIIAFIFSRLLRLSHAPYGAPGGAARGRISAHGRSEDHGRSHPGHGVGDHRTDCGLHVPGCHWLQPRSPAGFGGHRGHRHRSGCTDHRQRHAERFPDPDRGPVQCRRQVRAGRSERCSRGVDPTQNFGARRGWHAL